ncbi:MAG: efflux RND transporter periplasmic adaptor subunit [Humidesulfovibrio sp.]|nr:efflux RND transporter periplasmic adaptor subunit [Humidesulfovibrio sp.]
MLQRRLPLILPLAAALFLVACGGDKTPQPKTVSAPTVRATMYDAQECRSLPAEVRSQNSVTLSSKITGTVVEVLATEGQVVDKGQVILRIDDTELKQRVEAVLSTERQAGLERQAITARKDMAHTNLERMRKLFAQQAVSRDELDRADTEYLALKKQEQALAASAAAAGHQGAEARSLMGYSVVAAPFRGVLSRRYVDQGAFVTAGAPLAAIDDVQGGYELEAQADESLMSTMRKGLEVLGLVPSVSPQPFLTRLTTVVDRVDPATRTFKVRAAYNAPALMDNATATTNATTKATTGAAASANAQPHAGMFGKVCVPMLHARKLLIPATSVRQRGELATVLVVDDKGVLRLRLVKIGGAYLKAEIDGRAFIVQAQDEVLTAKSPGPGLMLEVLSGLSEGEVLVNGGPDTLREGDRLAVQKR